MIKKLFSLFKFNMQKNAARVQRHVAFLVLLAVILSACSIKDFNTYTTQNEASVANTLKVHFVDVGQGDCIFIQSENTNMLIDAGTSESANDICNYLDKLGITQIDYFVGTHPHEDHLGGAAAVILNYDVKTVYMTEHRSSSFFYEKLLDALIRKNMTVNVPKTGCIYKADGFDFEFLSPETDLKNENDNSIVMRIDYGETSILLMGDAEKNTEKYLLENKKNIKADIIKIGHHGSRNSTTTKFLNEVKPQVAVIQCGIDNSYGHPHEEAITRLEKFGVEILRCDESGTVVLTSDGVNVFSENGEKIKENNVQVEIKYIGNKKSKKYHDEDCPNLPSEKNSIIFFSEEEANIRGYSPCGSCNP